MERAAAELPPRPGASPGLLRRRYSVPETIMRKYSLAQQRSDSEESAPPTTRSAASASPPPADTPHRFVRRDRELMRKSALMRRMWGRPCEPCRSCCCCGAEPGDSAPYGGRETRSLDGSRSELRQLSSSFASPRYCHAAAGWPATPKRQRLDSSRDSRGSDEMLRAAMRNSYDRAEELRHERVTRGEFSDSTYQSHRHDPSPYIETITDAFTDSDGAKSGVRGDTDLFTQYSEGQSSDMAFLEIKSVAVDDVNMTSEQSAPFALSGARSLSDTSETYSASYPTTKENTMVMHARADQLARSAHIAGRVSEPSAAAHCDDNEALPYDKPLTIHTPSYEVLEIVVSETVNSGSVPAISTQTPDKRKHTLRAPTLSQTCAQNINIDEYVSNILVESLNSLTDQLECMNASMGSDRKISIVEKEIKVKLQNTGVNTIVHLSPTSNNQIIFGNEELCINEERKDTRSNPQDAPDALDDNVQNVQREHNALAIRDEVHSGESNNNVTSAGSPWPTCGCDSFDLRHNNVNHAVLQQIQKLFQDELHNLNADYSGNSMPEISHIEISNVTDVFIDNENEPRLAAGDDDPARGGGCEFISGVGAGSYYPDLDDNPVVPRFSAFPHTESMEVNTSSSDDAELLGSDCTSLVDSLDDPNSPRSVLLRRAFNNRRGELVRSAIDVLDLLPENVRNEEVVTPKDKGESFFIKIKDNDCDCDKENVNVADRMPEKIKQRLYRRHCKREMRMECARRTRSRQRPRDERRHDERCRGRRDVERDCVAIVNALVDDVIAKIAHDEYKYMRIKHRPAKMNTSKSDDNVNKRTWKKELEPIDDRENPYKPLKNSSTRYEYINTDRHKSERHQIHGKLSLLTRPSVASDDRAAKRVYQKSEIHDGNKCIEILEILEYVNGSQSSPETTNSDENQNNCMKSKKSRIPIPINEKTQRSPNNDSRKISCKRSSLPRAEFVERNGNTNRLIADMLLQALAEPEPPPAAHPTPPAARRASLPHAEPRSRSNSLRFKQMFDIIPEERSSFSVDSGTEDLNHNRRASAPDIADQYRESTDAECDDAPPALAPPAGYSPPRKIDSPSDAPRCKDMKSAGTSPITDSDGDKRALRSKNQITMTSPDSKSAATSPMRASVQAGSGPQRGRGRRNQGYNESAESVKVKPRRSLSTQYERAQDTRPRATGGDRAGPDRAGTDRTGPDRTGPGHAGTDRTGPDRTGPGHAGTDRIRAPPRPAPRRPHRVDTQAASNTSVRSPDGIALFTSDNKNLRKTVLEGSDEEEIPTPSIKLPEFKGGGESGCATSSDSSESGGSLLCSLAPKWLAQSRARRATRRRAHELAAPAATLAPPAPPAPPALPAHHAPPVPDSMHRPEHQPPGVSGGSGGSGGWSVTVAGSCRAALPADVEMRLRFPHERAAADEPCQESTCRHCATCACSTRAARETRAVRATREVREARETRETRETRAVREASEDRGSAPLLPPAAPRLARTDSSKLTLTMKKEALDSSILACKSVKKLGEPLPDVETYRASRSKLKSSVKMRRGYSLHCWLPENEVVPIRSSNGLSVLGSSIIPELKPRVPTMSERDLTRVYTPRHYLRS